ncbi:MAG: TIR domain-containing protein [Clostridium butyricum]
MAYRNGIYVAFNGCGTAVPTKSDIKYYDLLKAWEKNKNIDFSFIDSHSKTCQVRDDSLTTTLISRLNERLRNSKLLFLIVTENTKYGSKIVRHEITKSIDDLNLPIVVAYTNKEIVKHVTDNMKEQLPYVLKTRINSNSTKILFIPFKLNAIKNAFNCFGINDIKDKPNDIYVYSDVDSWD